MATIELPQTITREQEKWLETHIGPRLHYLHNSIGGQGWIVERTLKQENNGRYHEYWKLTVHDEKLATFFVLKFST
jgi:hypothetical protein